MTYKNFLLLLRLADLGGGVGRLSTWFGIGRSTLRFFLSDPCLSRKAGEEYENDQADVPAQRPDGDGGEQGIEEQGNRDSGHVTEILS